MSKKLTVEFIQEQFEAKDYTFLTKEYINNRQKLNYICPRGHIGKISWSDWQQGCRCGECNGRKKYTIEFVKSEFEKEGYTLLTEEYINNRQKLEYICPKKHFGSITFDVWQQGHRCIECAGCKKYMIASVKEQFDKENYILLTKIYKNAHQKLKYICPRGHHRTITWHGWQRGYRCQRCYFENNKEKNHSNWNPNLTEEDRQNSRKYFEYAEWNYAIKERDNFTCQVCGGNKGGNLVSHHIASYRSTPNLRTALSNGICLCENCHKNFHHQYGYGNNTAEQFEEFKRRLL